MKYIKSFLVIFCLFIFAVSCSEDDLGDFQQNDPEPEFRLFTMLDDYPALRSAFDSIDSYLFNDFLCDAMNDIPGDVKAVLEVFDGLMEKDTDSIGSFRSVLYRIINQEEVDRSPVDRFRDPGYATKDFPYYDMISDYIDPDTDQKINFTKPVLSMGRKVFSYLKYKFKDEEEMGDAVAALIEQLRDENTKGVINVLSEVLGKLFLQANDNIWYWDNRTLEDDEDIEDIYKERFSVNDSLCDREDIGKEGTVNSGLGNAARGMDAMFSGVEEELRDAEVKAATYEFIREVGKIFSSTLVKNGEEKSFSDISREFICNMEKYFTKGGEVYESEGGNNDYNRGYVDENGNVIGEINPNTGRGEFVNAELGNAVRNMFAVVPSLLTRSDRQHSAAYYDGERKTDLYYFISKYFEILKEMGFDPDNAHLEERLYDLLRFDVYGRDRMDKIDSDDISEKPYAANHLLHMMMLIALGENYGWWDAHQHIAPAEMGDFYNFNFGHGPLESSGYLTLNDIFFYIGFEELFGATLYELALWGNKQEATHCFRSMKKFGVLKRDGEGGFVPDALNYMYRINPECNVLSIMPILIAGDAGVPWGGNPGGWDIDLGDEENFDEQFEENVLVNGYKPFSVDGRGEPDIINLFLTSFCRFVYDGQGPFYAKEGMKFDDQSGEYIYYRPDGREYVRIRKPDPDNPLGDNVNSKDPHCLMKDEGDFKFIEVDPEDATDEDYDESHRIQKSDDWHYYYPVCDGDTPWEEWHPEFEEEYRGHRKNCRYYFRVKNDYLMMHLDDVLIFYDQELLERDVDNSGGEPQDFVDETGEYYGGEAVDVNVDGVIENYVKEDGEYTDPEKERRVRERLLAGFYDIYCVPNEEIGIYGDITGVGSIEPIDKILVASNPDKRIKWEKEQLEKFKSGRITIYEVIPEKSIDRECDTRLETLYRNLQFYLADKKFGLCVPLYMGISIREVLAAASSMVLDYLPWIEIMVMGNPVLSGILGEDNLEEAIWKFIIESIQPTPILDTKLVQSANFFIGEGNGAYGMGKMRFHEFKDDEMGDYPNVNGKWKKKRDFEDVDLEEHPNGIMCGGQSYIPGDTRMYLMYVADDLYNTVGILVNDFFEGQLLKLVSDLFRLVNFQIPLYELKEGFASFMINHFLGRGAILGGGLSASMPGFSRMAFPRCVDPRNPENTIEFIGSRKGELLKDRDWKYMTVSEEIHPAWGFEADDSDPNWPRRQSFLVEAFIALVITLREAGGIDIPDWETFLKTKGKVDNEGNYNIHAPNNTYNPSKAILDTLCGALINPITYYQPGDDGSFPRNTWFGRFVDDHCLFQRTDRLNAKVEDGETLWEPSKPWEYLKAWENMDPADKQDSWEERGYYQPANLVNLLTVSVDSDPYGDFHDTPKRCDGLLPLLTEYDVTRPIGPDNLPKTRIITKIFKLAMALTDPKFDEHTSTFDEKDYTTWSIKEKLRYGFEQLITSIKCRKGDRIKINETNRQRVLFWPEIYTYPKWMFSDDGIRSEDIDLDKLIDELIGSDESGKGLAVIPDSRPNPEDWKNFYLFLDSFGELLSNDGETKGRYNVMEDLIDLIDLFNMPDVNDEYLKGLRHTVGVMFAKFNRDSGQWENPDELTHVITDIVPDILESFNGRYYSLCTVIDSLMKKDGFLEWFIYTLDSEHSGREIFEQLYAFLGEDFISQQDAAFWEDFGELMTGLASLIVADSGAEDEWLKDDIFHSNDDVFKSAEPFQGLGELLSW